MNFNIVDELLGFALIGAVGSVVTNYIEYSVNNNHDRKMHILL